MREALGKRPCDHTNGENNRLAMRDWLLQADLKKNRHLMCLSSQLESFSGAAQHFLDEQVL